MKPLPLRPLDEKAVHLGNLVDRNAGGGKTSDDLIQAAAGPKP